MSNNLDAMDETLPDGSVNIVADLDDFLRETRLNLKDWADREHVKNGGRHKFAIGNTAGRPATPTTGMVYINTETGAWEYYTGAAWITTNKASRSIIVCTGASFAGGLTRFFGSLVGAADVDARMPMPYKGTIKNMYIEINTPATTGESFTYTAFKNGIAQGVTTSISGAAATTASDLTHTFNVAAGDTVSVRVVATAGAAVAVHKISLEHIEIP